MQQYYIKAILDQDVLDELSSYPRSRVLILKVDQYEEPEELKDRDSE